MARGSGPTWGTICSSTPSCKVSRSPLFGDGRQSRGNTYVTDVAAANLAAMAHGPTGEAFNIGGGMEITANDLIARLETIIGRNAIIRRAPARAGEQSRTLADIGKAQRVLGWTPAVGLDEGLRAQVEWQRRLAIEIRAY